MFEIFELDSPDDNYVNSEEVVFEFWKKQKEQQNLELAIHYETGLFAKIFSDDYPNIILPSSFRQLDKSAIEKFAIKGFSFFLFTNSESFQIIEFFKNYGYITTQFPIKNVLDSIPPLDGARFNEVLDFVKVIEWKGRIVFFSHDACPAYILDVK